MRPKAILFDLDDTLISPQGHRTGFWRDAFTEVWGEHHGDTAALPDDLETMLEGIKLKSNAVALSSDFKSFEEHKQVMSFSLKCTNIISP